MSQHEALTIHRSHTVISPQMSSMSYPCDQTKVKIFDRKKSKNKKSRFGMYSSRMRTVRSSSRLLDGGGGFCLSACWDTHSPARRPPTSPPEYGPGDPPPAKPLNLSPGYGPGDPPARHLNLPFGYGPGDPLPREQNDRHV